MKKTFLLSVLVCIILTSCNGQKNIPTVFPSLTPKPSSTVTAIAKPSSTRTPIRIQPTELPSTPTITPFPPYPTKQVVFDYYVTGNLADDLAFFAPESCCSITKLVLYDDGQMLLAGAGETYKRKVLSSAEIKSFLSKLETLGFYSIESNQQHGPTDKLYNFQGKYQEVGVIDGLKDCILVNSNRSRQLCVEESYLQFLIPKMKNILRYLDEYKLAGMTPYSPDRILLTIQVADPSVENPPANPWKEQFPSLDPSTPNRYVSDTSSQVIFIDGEMAKEIYLFFEGADSKVVSQDEQEYILYIRVVLPHEKVTNPNP